MKKLKKGLKIFSLVLVLYVFLAFISPFSKTLQNRSIENQINYLIKQSNADIELQMRYPEGYVFFNSLLALSIIDYSHHNLKGSHKYLNDLDHLLKKLLSSQATNSFPQNQKINYGAFYNGWVNFTLKKYLESELIHNSMKKNHFKQSHDSLSNLIALSQSIQLEILDSYPGSHWPADNLVCAASVNTSHSDLANNWTSLLKSSSKTNLIYHDDTNKSKARGSSQGLIIYLLSQLNEDFAKTENDRFKSRFIDRFLGVQFVKEDLKNTSFSDIDSGPVILGYGSVATIVNVKAQRSVGQPTRITQGFLNVLGLPINMFGEKFYLFKQEIMFDVFMLWMQT